MIIYAREKEVLRALKRSLSAWINNTLGSTVVNAENLLEKLSTGVILCRLARCIQQRVDDVLQLHPKSESQSMLKYWESAKRETFFARDNAEVFIRWCKSFGVRDAVLFESDGLVLKTQPRSVILCLSEVSRLAARFGVLLPPPIQLSTAVDGASDSSDEEVDFFYAAKSPRLGILPRTGLNKTFPAWDSGCSSGGGRSPPWSSSSSPTAHLSPSPPSSVLKRTAPLETKTMTKVKDDEKSDAANEVVIVVRSGSKLDVSSSTKPVPEKTPDSNDRPRKVQVARETSPRHSSPQTRRGPMGGSHTISSRMKANHVGIDRSASSISDWRTKKAKTASYDKRFRLSTLDQQVLDTARKLHKDESRIHRISDGLYSFGDKNVFLRVVRGNNVVVRLGGGWDTLEHYMSTLDFNKWESLQRKEREARKRQKYWKRNLATYLTL